MSSEEHVLLFSVKCFEESLPSIDLCDRWSSMTALFRCDGALEVITRLGKEELKKSTFSKIRIKLGEMKKKTKEYEEKDRASSVEFLDQKCRYDAIKLLEYYVSRFELLACN